MDASCQCGALRAAVAANTRPFVALCHCADCQRRSGSPFGVVAYFPRETISVAGAASEYVRRGESGYDLTTGFCATCGSTIYIKLGKPPQMVGIPVGAFADPAFPRPTVAVWEQHKHHWVETPQGVTGFARGTE